MIKYFNQTDELTNIQQIPVDQFRALGGITSKANYVDSFKRLVGVNSEKKLVPVQRAIEYKKQPSLHVCNAKCLGGKFNGTCECQCGGKNHGLGMFTNILQTA